MKSSFRTPVSMRFVAMLFAGALVAGCDDESVDPVPSTGGDNAGGSSTGEGGTPSDGGSGGAPVQAPQTVRTIAGDLTWHVAFDAAAQDAGATNCIYTRHYEGVEDRSAAWLCPSCDIMFLADVEMTVGLEDCYSQVSDAQPLAQEWIGYGGGRWYRGIGGPTTDQGSALVGHNHIETANTVEDLEALVGGTLSFDIVGALDMDQAEGDPLNGFEPPATYACGWPKSDAPPYEGDYTVAVDQVVPDGLFMDVCDEPVRLHDFKGSYLVIDMAARDCPPCRSMAGDEEQFVSDMAAEGIDVHVITLLAPSLSDTLGTTTTAMLQGWIDDFELTSPVLGDRGWGLTMFSPTNGDPASYPTWVVVRPDLTVITIGNGFLDFEEHKQAILDDQP